MINWNTACYKMFAPPGRLMLCARAVAMVAGVGGPGRGLVMSGDRSDAANNSTAITTMSANQVSAIHSI